MKKFYIFIIMSLILVGSGALSVLYIKYSKEKTLTHQEELWNKDKQELQKELDEIFAQIDELKQQKSESDIPELEPQALIARLRKMKDWSEICGDQTVLNPTLKKQIHDQLEEAFFIFQCLENKGGKSLNTIREYLASGHNITLYKYSSKKSSNSNQSPFSIYKLKKIDNQIKSVPETSRLGMLYVLGNIRTSAALNLLCQTMQNSTDLKEITCAGDILLNMNKKIYSQPILDIYKMIFPNLDRNDQNILLTHIKKVSENDFKEILQSLALYDENGKLAMDILCLRIENLGEMAIPDAYNAFNRANADFKEKLNILNAVEKFIGSNRQANSMFISLMNNMEGNDKDFIGGYIVRIIASDSKEEEKQRQFLNLLNRLSIKQDDQSEFAENVELAKSTLTYRIKEGWDLVMLPSYEQEKKRRDAAITFMERYNMDGKMLQEFKNAW